MKPMSQAPSQARSKIGLHRDLPEDFIEAVSRRHESNDETTATGQSSHLDAAEHIARSVAIALDRVEVLTRHKAGFRKIRIPSFRGLDHDVINVCGLAPGESRPFMAVLSGTMAPAVGIYKLANRNLQQMPAPQRRAFLARFLGTALRCDALLPHVALRPNIALPLLANDFPLRVAMELADAQVRQLGLGPVADRLPHDLTPYQRRLASLGKALVHRPLIMLCELPELHLTDDQVGALKHLLWKASRVRGTCIVMIAADDRFSSVASVTLRFDDGRPVPPRAAAS